MSKRNVKFCFLISLLIVSGLNCVRTFTGRLTDENGRSVPGALVYIEAYTNNTYDFTWSISGDSGEVPSKDFPKLRFFMKPWTKFTYCVLAPQRVPFIINDRTGVFKNGDVGFIIKDDINAHSKYNPLLFHLEFPFEENLTLNKKLTLPEQKILIERFSDSYKNARDNSDSFSSEAYRKMEHLDSLVIMLKDK
jgi:hypothetical protein